LFRATAFPISQDLFMYKMRFYKHSKRFTSTSNATWEVKQLNIKSTYVHWTQRDKSWASCKWTL